jgi:hypothetical protein
LGDGSDVTTASPSNNQSHYVWNYFLQELRDQGLLVIKHIAGERNDADIFTKNLTSTIFDRHVPLYVGKDDRGSSGEAVSN